MLICCATCWYHLGGGACRIDLEADCGEGGYEAWEDANHFDGIIVEA